MDGQYRCRIVEANCRYRIIKHKLEQSKLKRIDQVELKAFGERIYYTHLTFWGRICIQLFQLKGCPRVKWKSRIRARKAAGNR